MSERLIPPHEYTPEILAALYKIKARMDYTMTEYQDDDLRVFEDEGKVYVLANPVLGTEIVWDEASGLLTQTEVPMRNMTLIYERDWLRHELNGSVMRTTFTPPRPRLLRPDLCIILQTC